MKRAGRNDLALDWLWFLAWALASSVWCITAASQLGATFDEPFYVASGLDFWRSGSHRSLLKKGTMPLPIDLFSLPLALWERWSGTQFDPVLDLERLLPWARAGTLAFWWLLLGYARRIGRQLAGPWGGRLAVAWLAFEPNLLAHASLATTDIAMTACLLALLYSFRTGREAGWIRRVGVPTLWFAATVLSKASGLVLGPVCLLVLEIERLVSAEALKAATLPSGPWMRLRQGLRRLQPFRRDLVHILVGGLVLVFVYSGSDWREEPSFVAWARSLPDGPGSQVIVWVSEHLRIFSNAGEGLVKQIAHNIRGHGAYLLGRTHRRALWFYFPVLLTIKLTLPLLIAPGALAAIRPRALANWATLTAAALLVMSVTFRVQIGIRLVLPMVGLAVVGLSAAVVQAWRESSGWGRHALTAGAVAGVAWTVSASLIVWPHGLSYVNELWGGTSRGYLYVSESNYDWGQGLKDLAEWQRRNGMVPVDVWYFGTDPALKRLPVREVPLHALPIQVPEDVVSRVKGHYLAVSMSLLYYVTSTEAHRHARAFLLTRKPVARTTTFFIYDFRNEQTEGQTAIPQASPGGKAVAHHFRVASHRLLKTSACPA